MKNRLRSLARFLESCAWHLALFLMLGLAAAGLVMTAQLRAPEVVRYVGGNIVVHVFSALVMTAIVYALSCMLMRFRCMKKTAVVMWVAAVVVFLLGAYTRQEVDFMYVCDAAERFAHGDYSPLHQYYFNECSYQLGTVFMLECVARLVPQVRVELLMQGVNVLMSMSAALMLTAVGRMVFGDRRMSSAAMAVYLLCLPMALYGIHVYGTLPMVLLCSGAMLSFVLYIQRGQRRFGLLYALLSALAYMIKPNSAIVLMALLICAVLYAMESADWRLVGFALLSWALAVLLAKLVILQYEWRSGVTLREDVTMLSRLVMGLQDSKRAAGWYNGYIEQFFDAAVSIEQEKAVAMADLTARMGEMADNPMRTAVFFVQKALSQWLEPTYGTLLYGNYCRQVGPLAGAAQMVFSEQSALRMVLEDVMKAWQLMLYALSAVGMGTLLHKKVGAVQLVLPITILGGGLYHMIFEAKSQYIYVYAMYLVPVAAYGLCVLRDLLCKWISKKKP